MQSNGWHFQKILNPQKLLMFTAFDKGNSLSATNSAKCGMATIIHILIYDSFNKPLVNKKYMAGTFNI